jgi:Mn2+/Fe2+ NRAMP family transporter
MKVLYKPFAMIARIIAARLGRSLFKGLWSRIDEAEPPKATTRDASLPKVVGAAALEAATMAGVAAAVNRVSARWFQYLTGIWPGDKEKKQSEDG